MLKSISLTGGKHRLLPIEISNSYKGVVHLALPLMSEQRKRS